MKYRGQLGIPRWSLYINAGAWKPRDFDLIIIELLNYALQGKISKIMLSLPRRSGKSTLISKNFVSYYLSHFPNENVILSSYSQLLASNFGKDVKNIIKEFGGLSPYNVQLATDSKANNKFHISNPYTGRMLAVGQAGSIIGFGASLIIVDDPLKNPKEARSRVITENLKEWFFGVLKTSLEFRKNGLPPIMVVIAQRLGVNDLHGIIQQEEPCVDAKEALEILRNGGIIPPDTWVNCNFPSICVDSELDLLGRKEGEVLWPEMRPYDWLMAEKKAMGSFLFESIYQGQPQERDGPIFKREYFYDENGDILSTVLVKDLPDGLNELRYWDLAASSDDGDNLAATKTAFLNDKIIVRGILTGKYSASQVLNRFEAVAVKDGVNCRIMVEQEPGSASKILIQKFRQLESLRAHPKILADKVKVSKLDRSLDLEIMAENGDLLFDTDALSEKDIRMIIDQLISFDGQDGGVDDITDTLTGSARYWKKPRRKVIV